MSDRSQNDKADVVSRSTIEPSSFSAWQFETIAGWVGRTGETPVYFDELTSQQQDTVIAWIEERNEATRAVLGYRDCAGNA